MRLLRGMVVACLMFAIGVQGATAAVVGMLGSSHSHRTVQVDAKPADISGNAMGGWQDFRRTAHLGDTSMHRHGEGPVHSHSQWQRHHHDIADPTVVSHDGGADPSGAVPDAVSFVAGFVFVPSSRIGTAAGSLHAVGDAWCLPADARVQSQPSAPLDRPPKSA